MSLRKRIMTPPPRGLILFGDRLVPRSWADALRLTARMMLERHPGSYRRIMLSLPRWLDCSGTSALAIGPDSDYPYPGRYAFQIGEVFLYKCYDAQGAEDAVDIILRGFGYDPGAVRTWITEATAAAGWTSPPRPPTARPHPEPPPPADKPEREESAVGMDR